MIGIYCVLRCVHCNPILPLLPIDGIAEVDWDAIFVKWFRLECERSRLILITSTTTVTYTGSNGTEVAECVHDDNLLVNVE